MAHSSLPRIVIAPDKFKEALTAREVCAAIERGVRRVLPNAQVASVPMADGGDGTADALLAATGGSWRRTVVTGPLGEPVEAAWGILGDGETAVIEMASASGLALVPVERRDPTRTTTFGTGELIKAAIQAGASRILVGIGGSATTDGGLGAAQACGVVFYSQDGTRFERPLTGGDLPAIERIEVPRLNYGTARQGGQNARRPREQGERNARPPESEIVVACDVDNPLVGERGAAAVYGPQKGATAEQVALLDRGLAHLADVVRRDLGVDVRDVPGAGAAGGLGAGLLAFFGATMQPGIQMVMEATGLAEKLRGADLLITGEGRLDRQSMMGKVIAGVARAGQAAGVPAIALVGCTGEGAEESLQLLQSYHRITPEGMALPEALRRTSEFLETKTAEVLAAWRGD